MLVTLSFNSVASFSPLVLGQHLFTLSSCLLEFLSQIDFCFCRNPWQNILAFQVELFKGDYFLSNFPSIFSSFHFIL